MLHILRTAERLSRRSAVALLVVIVLSSGVLGSLMLTRGQNWGDDFAMYLMQAKSITTGGMNVLLQRSTFTAEQSRYSLGPITYPWGFPLMLAPVWSLVGFKLLAFKLVLTLSFMAFLVALFLLAHTGLGVLESLLVVLVVAFSPVLLQAQDQILSDIPFLLWSTTALWIIAKYRNENPATSRSILISIAVGSLIFLADFMRPNGILLFIPLIVVQWIQLRGSQAREHRWMPLAAYFVLPYMTFAFFYAAQAMVFPSSGEGYLAAFAPVSEQTVLHNLEHYLSIFPVSLLAPLGGLEKVIVWLLWLFFLYGAARAGRRGLPWLLYALATFGLYVIFPAVQDRYIYALIPAFFVLVMEGMKAAVAQFHGRYQGYASAVCYLLFASLAIAALGSSVDQARHNMLASQQVPDNWTAGPFSTSSTQMFTFIRDATPSRSVVIFFKPRAMRLLTDRDSMSTAECGDLPKADYIVLVNLQKARPNLHQISPQQVTGCNPSVVLTSVFESESFIVYKISLVHGYPPPSGTLLLESRNALHAATSATCATLRE